MIDLQNHTIASDGELTPEELIDLAVEKGLSAIAITDHDSLDSIEAALEYSKDKNIEVVPGIELSCDDTLYNYDKIDVLGLFIDFKNKKLIDLAEHIKNKREDNKRLIIEKLKSFGYEIEYEDVKKNVKGTFGRPHIAKYLLKKYPDKFSSVKDVFDKLIGVGKPAFIETSNRVSIENAIKIIRGSGGISILAHPGIYAKEESLKIIDYFIDKGGDGIETYYPYHIICPELRIDNNENNKLINFYKKIVKSKGILESGGNDHHGNYRPTLGKIKIPDKILEGLRKSLNKINKRPVEENWVLWFTGLHGSGKSTIAGKLIETLRSKNIPVVLLDGDELRKAISSDLGYTTEERNEHMMRVANLCKIISENGILAIASVTSPTEKSREYARTILKKMLLVYVKCPLDMCEKRDVKGHYKKALSKEKGFENFVHGSANFEEPKNPGIILNTDKESIEKSVNKLISKLKEIGMIKEVFKNT